jgi:hypothetical protein
MKNENHRERESSANFPNSMKIDFLCWNSKMFFTLAFAFLFAACSRQTGTTRVDDSTTSANNPNLTISNHPQEQGHGQLNPPVTGDPKSRPDSPSLSPTSRGADFYLSVGKLSEEEVKALLAENLSLEQRQIVINRYAFILGQRSTSDLVAFLNTLSASDLAASAAAAGAQSTAQRQGSSLEDTLGASETITNERIRSGFIRGALTAGATSDLLKTLSLGAKYGDQITAQDYNELLSDSFASLRLNGQFGDFVSTLTDTDYRLVSQHGLADEFAQWSTENHADALAILNEIPKDNFTAPLYYGFAREWAGTDISNAFNWVTQLANGPARDRAVAGLVLHLRNENVEQAVEMAETISDEAWREYSIKAANDVSFGGALPNGGIE